MLCNYFGRIGDEQDEEFLRSDEQMSTNKGFTVIDQARKQAKTCFRSSKYCLVKISEATGRGADASISITKTKVY